MEHYAAHVRPLPVALARCLVQTKPAEQLRLATLNRLFNRLSGADQGRCRDEALWLRLQLADARDKEAAIRAELERAGAHRP